MAKTLNILIVEDSASDAGLLARQIERAGYDLHWQRVDTAADLKATLEREPWDAVLCDYTMPDFSGIDALAVVRASQEDLPFIFVSGTIGEDTAVEAMRAGAQDYVLKGHLKRLVPAIEREVRAAEIHRQVRQAEHLLGLRTRALEATASAVVITDRQGQIQWVNPAFTVLTGYAAEEAVGNNPRLLKSGAHDRKFYENFWQTITSGQTWHGEFVNRRKDGSLWFDEHTVTPIRDNRGKIAHFISVMHDVTERKQREESFARLAMAVEQAEESIVMTDLEANIVYVNPAFERNTGYTRAEVMGKNPRFLQSGKQDAQFYRQMWDVLKRGEVWRGHFINKRKDGGLFEEEAIISPVRDAAGKVINYVAVKRDMTHEKQLEAEFRQSQKMEAFGQLAGGVAHDFNNILAVIHLQAGLLKLDKSLTVQQFEIAGEIEKATQCAANLTRQLLLFSRKQTLQPCNLKLNDVVANFAKMLERTLGEQIELQFKYSEETIAIHADPGMIDQVLLNLAVNARDAMPKGGQIVIETSAVEFDEVSALQTPQARPGSFACLSVTDGGCGIPPEILPRIFEPFFTTKTMGQGTGLGLATVFGIVEQHKGWIDVYSEVGRGATFRVYLPRCAKTSDPISFWPSWTPHRGGNETILLVEDEATLRASLRIALSRLGYRVLEASAGDGALEVWRQHHDEIRLLLTDLVMPGGMTGKELAERLLQQDPKLKVIYSQRL